VFRVPLGSGGFAAALPEIAEVRWLPAAGEEAWQWLPPVKPSTVVAADGVRPPAFGCETREPDGGTDERATDVAIRTAIVDATYGMGRRT
jgi:hypothetical protein